MDIQLIPTPSLDFQVALNLGETAPLIIITITVIVNVNVIVVHVIVKLRFGSSCLTGKSKIGIPKATLLYIWISQSIMHPDCLARYQQDVPLLFPGEKQERCQVRACQQFRHGSIHNWKRTIHIFDLDLQITMVSLEEKEILTTC